MTWTSPTPPKKKVLMTACTLYYITVCLASLCWKMKRMPIRCFPDGKSNLMVFFCVHNYINFDKIPNTTGCFTNDWYEGKYVALAVYLSPDLLTEIWATNFKTSCHWCLVQFLCNLEYLHLFCMFSSLKSRWMNWRARCISLCQVFAGFFPLSQGHDF